MAGSQPLYRLMASGSHVGWRWKQKRGMYIMYIKWDTADILMAMV